MTTTTLPDGRDLAWAEYGAPTGLPVVFLHGTPGGRIGRAAHHERFAREGLRVLCPDRAGYGGSDRDPGRTVRSAADDVVGLLDALGLPAAVVMGGSGGGPHALAVAAAAPERVLAVGVLVGAAPLDDADVAGMAEVNRRVLGMVRAGEDLDALLAPIRENLLERGPAAVLDGPESDRALWESRAADLRRELADALAPGTGGMADDYRALWGAPWGFDLAEVTRPVVWVHGRDDRAVPFAAAARAAAALPACRLVPLDAGHAIGPDRLAEFEAAVLAAAVAGGAPARLAG
jgi:pimeloyl-ACP methyl ester carboxylesterase